MAARCNCDALVTIKGNAVIVEGITDEFAGAYMKKGTLILTDSKGFVGANLKDGVIFVKRKIKIASPVQELTISQEDANQIMRYLGLGHVEAMSYRKYGIKMERLVRMRDGSVVVMEKEE